MNTPYRAMISRYAYTGIVVNHSVSSVLSFLFYAFVTGLVIYEVLWFRVGVVNKVLYLFAFVFAIAIVFYARKRTRFYYLSLFFFISVVAGLTFNGVEHSARLYFFTDALLLLSGVAFSLILSTSDQRSFAFFEKWVIAATLLTVFAFFLNWFFGFERINGRFPAPNSYVLTLFFVLLMLSWRRHLRHFFLGMSGVVVFGAWFAVLAGVFVSGDRTSFLILMLAGMAYVLSYVQRSALLLPFFVLGVFVSIYALFYGSGLGGFRALNVFQLSSDHSFMQRIYEASDVLYYVGQSFASGGWAWLVGFGPGALFDPVSSYSAKNVLENGLVHHIHSTPFVILYRFGVIGALAWFLFLFYVGLSGFRLFRITGAYPVLVLVLLIVVDQLLRNVLVNPVFFLSCSFLLFGTRVYVREFHKYTS